MLAPIAQSIADIASSRWGMVTTAQARVHGVARANLAHRVRTGALERTGHHGVYRLAAAPTSPLDDLRAAWLTTNPASLAPERTAVPLLDAVVASAAAAMVHGMGDVYRAPHRIIVPGRRQSAKGDVTYSWRALDSRDVEVEVEVVDGLPVTTASGQPSTSPWMNVMSLSPQMPCGTRSGAGATSMRRASRSCSSHTRSDLGRPRVTASPPCRPSWSQRAWMRLPTQAAHSTES